MKKDFDSKAYEDFTYTVEVLATGRKKVIKAKQIVSIEDDGEGQPLITYRAKVNTNKLEQFSVKGEMQGLLNGINGVPDNEIREALKDEIIKARQARMPREIKSTHNLYDNWIVRAQSVLEDNLSRLRTRIKELKQRALASSEKLKAKKLSKQNISAAFGGKATYTLVLVERVKLDIDIDDVEASAKAIRNSEEYHITEEYERCGKTLQEFCTMCEYINIAMDDMEECKKKHIENISKINADRITHVKQVMNDLGNTKFGSQWDNRDLRRLVENTRYEHQVKHGVHFKEQSNGKFENQVVIDAAAQEKTRLEQLADKAAKIKNDIKARGEPKASQYPRSSERSKY